MQDTACLLTPIAIFSFEPTNGVDAKKPQQQLTAEDIEMIEGTYDLISHHAVAPVN